MPSEVASALTSHGYLPDEGLATAIFLALSLQRPLLLEGEAGVGKTEVAKVLSRWTGGELIRLQCYEGIDAAQAVYDWDYSRQLLHLRAAEATGEARGLGTDALEEQLYHERFLLKRALLQAIDHTDDDAAGPADRRDRPRRRRVRGVPARGAVRLPDHRPRARRVHATDRPPVVILTSNRTRDVHDALKRRCLYHWVEHPSFEREVQHRAHARAARDRAARRARSPPRSRRCAAKNLYKPPGVAETIDWATALAALGVQRARRGDRRRHARRGAEVPRGPGARPPAGRPRRHREAGVRAQARSTDERPAATRPPRARRRRAAGGRVRPRAARLGLRTSRSAACSTSPRRSALSGSSERDGVYWAARCTLRAPARGPRRCSIGRSRCSGSSAGRGRRRRARRGACGSRSPSTTRTSDDGDADGADGRATTRRCSCASRAAEVLRNKDFAAYDDDELQLAQAADGQLRFAGPPRAVVPLAAVAPRRRARPARHGARVAARRRRADPAPLARAGRAAAPAGAAARRQRLDGAVRAGDAALRPRRRRRPPAGRGVRARAPGSPG